MEMEDAFVHPTTNMIRQEVQVWHDAKLTKNPTRKSLETDVHQRLAHPGTITLYRSSFFSIKLNLTSGNKF
jgi:hypothetical protein